MQIFSPVGNLFILLMVFFLVLNLDKVQFIIYFGLLLVEFLAQYLRIILPVFGTQKFMRLISLASFCSDLCR